MDNNHGYFFKIATNCNEFERIHQLNYQTFSEEIPQHEKNEQKKLVDSFHHENTYIICIKDDELIGMVAVRDNRPFSLDRKIGAIEDSLPISINRPCEVRLLAVKKEFRNGRVFVGLAQFLAQYCLEKGYDVAVISGTVRQLKLYNQMGFQPFAKMTGTEEALFQPMYLTKETFEASLAGRILHPAIPFLPGPVQISDGVRAALMGRPYSHRTKGFLEKLNRIKDLLCDLTNSKHVQVLLGSGTLANEVVAAQLSLIKGRGLILANGEFGSRLVEQAQRQGLNFDVLEKEWGQAFSKEEIVEKLSNKSTWIWAVHSETSTGMLNDLTLIKRIAEEYSLKLCLDCISSIGAMELDLSGVFLATGVSGKALRAFTGLSFVFHHHEVAPSSAIPKYIDLGVYMVKDSIPFSHSSNFIEALLVAVESITPETYRKISETHQWLRNNLKHFGYHLITSNKNNSPMILTIELPKAVSSYEIGKVLHYNGYLLHFESEYLRQRNWMQIACIGDYSTATLETMTNLLYQVVTYELKQLQASTSKLLNEGA
ncbi:aminotransferase class V-fold PLP-dependent enzyme [Neobacillus sp. WH10]|uniref:aminotransferase class V-fold PLP-dependent enzyme n=1 Tax=Neobacillus sp. WH10 TaxID=3047873 RepID=UPI0024C1CB71|nr:aminotransferase class V-fold PLP-dependent enzyme [Neobacillus sp. WH10]WHY76979.1 aminotransferase class V-fold PLP-dependent enzyme [Neobacillus sp. WH10]